MYATRIHFGAPDRPLDGETPEAKTPEAVGYKKPPKSGQFKKGKSPNPKGRPKKKVVEDLALILDEFMAEPITLRTNGQQRTMNKLEAFAEVLRIEAIKGDPKATRQFVKIAAKTGLFSKDIAIPGVQICEPTTSDRNGKILRGMKALHAANGSAGTPPIVSPANS